MATNDNVNQAQFHGSKSEMAPGDLAWPSANLGEDAPRNSGRPNRHTYSTTDPMRAEGYAKDFNRNGADFGRSGFVYQLRPLRRMTPDTRHPAHHEGYKTAGPMEVISAHQIGHLEVHAPFWGGGSGEVTGRVPNPPETNRKQNSYRPAWTDDSGNEHLYGEGR